MDSETTLYCPLSTVHRPLRLQRPQLRSQFPLEQAAEGGLLRADLDEGDLGEPRVDELFDRRDDLGRVGAAGYLLGDGVLTDRPDEVLEVGHVRQLRLDFPAAQRP